MSIGIIGVRYQDRIERWIARRAAPRLAAAQVISETSSVTEST